MVYHCWLKLIFTETPYDPGKNFECLEPQEEDPMLPFTILARISGRGLKNIQIVDSEF